MKIKEIKKELNGHEVNSLIFEGCVGIENGVLLPDGEKIQPTSEEWRELWSEYVEQELVVDMNTPFILR